MSTVLAITRDGNLQATSLFLENNDNSSSQIPCHLMICQKNVRFTLKGLLHFSCSQLPMTFSKGDLMVYLSSIAERDNTEPSDVSKGHISGACNR